MSNLSLLVSSDTKLATKLAILTLTLAALLSLASCFRTGAPQMACSSLRPLHALHRPKPASASQFYLTQSSLSYLPGDNITVEVATSSSERHFRGFIVQAYEPSTGTPVGHFLPTQDSRPISGCSAATHRNHAKKQLAQLMWVPSMPADATPDHHRGQSPSFATSWLGLRGHRVGSGARSFKVPGGTLISSGIYKRQLPEEEPTAAAAAAPRFVRFRATIVVSYEEFYSGFESTDQKFDKFDYAPTNKPTLATTAEASAAA